MRQFVIAGSPDGQRESLAKLQTCVRERRPEGVLVVGGVSGNEGSNHKDKLKRWQDLFTGLGDLGVFTAVIPGAGAAPLQEFLRLAKNAEESFPHLHFAHATLLEEGDVAINGLGGELTETEDHTEEQLSYARASAEYFLRTLWTAEQPHKILLLSVAPPGQLGGEAGNRICGDFIDSYHPSLCVVEGTTERRGYQCIAHTQIVNPGRLTDGSAAWLDWNKNRNEQVELIQV
jgi:hypothetical protein